MCTVERSADFDAVDIKPEIELPHVAAEVHEGVCVILCCHSSQGRSFDELYGQDTRDGAAPPTRSASCSEAAN
jgi:hypothetical protein